MNLTILKPIINKKILRKSILNIKILIQREKENMRITTRIANYKKKRKKNSLRKQEKKSGYVMLT